MHQRHRQTDGQTDHMQSQDRALQYSASRGKKDVIHKTESTQRIATPPEDQAVATGYMDKIGHLVWSCGF